MTSRQKYRPFTNNVERPTVLNNPPLAAVLCQVSWPKLSEFQSQFEEAATRFGESLKAYPITSNEQEIAYRISQEGKLIEVGDMLYKWSSDTELWNITLGKRFLTFHSKEYEGFENFIERFEPVLQNLYSVVKIPQIERIGMRYVNQITDREIVLSIDEMIKPEVLGLAEIKAIAEEVGLVQSVNSAEWKIGTAEFAVKTGIVGPNQQADPLIPIYDFHTWVMDIDASEIFQKPMETSDIIYNLGKLADISVDFFRYMANEKFLKNFAE